MAILFGEYELLAQSGLFDAAFYLAANPDVAALNVDPLLHYLEAGGRERRDPSADFDTAYYLAACGRLGETPDNPLAHYLTVGIRHGLLPRPERAAATLLCVDVPRLVDGVADAPVHGGLSIVGWGMSAAGTAAVEVLLDGVRITAARHGLRRPDVAAAHPEWQESLLSGFAAHLPPKALPVGRHRVAVTIRSHDGHEATSSFDIDVAEVSGELGPTALRRKVPQAEIDRHLGTLGRLRWRPGFAIVLPFTSDPDGLAAARRTLDSLARQAYGDWQAWLVPRPAPARKPRAVPPKSGARAAAATPPPALPASLTAGLEFLAGRIRLATAADFAAPAGGAPGTPAAPIFVARLAPGDEFGRDALLEFALAGAFDQDREFWYCDDRRRSPVDGREDAYFKPAWSPDLLLASNYIGRAWCAGMRLLARAGIGLAELAEAGDYDLALRLTEAARGIGAVPKCLLRNADGAAPAPATERAALAAAVARRGLAATLEPGGLAGVFRLRRAVRRERVSIVIATCAAGGLIKTCVETLREVTAYRDYEIVCIENIPRAAQHWKGWLRAHADVVIGTREPFNWSRFNNLAAARATGEHLLFLNDDVEIIEAGWLEALLEHSQRPEVGVTGALLLYPDRSVQHAGVMLDDAGRGRHAFRHLAESDPGYFGLAATARNVISVTGACLMTRRDTFAALEGFDEAHAVINNDLDYCLRAGARGLIQVYTPHARLIHHELASRAEVPEQYDAAKFRQRWRTLIAQGDPYFNRNLSREHEQFRAEAEPLEVVTAGRLMARDAIQRILVVKLDHIGDCITALPAVRRLQRRFPAARFTVLTSRASAPVWTALAGLEESIEFDFFHARSGLGAVAVGEAERAALAQRLRERHFDLAIDLRKHPETREILNLSGAAVLAGFDTQGRFPWLDVALEWDEDVPLRTKRGHIADDLIALVDAVAARCEADDPPPAAPGPVSLPATEQRRLFARPLICLHPASGSPMRQWPLEKFNELIDLLLAAPELHVAVIGGKDEAVYVKPLFAKPVRPRLFNLVGRFGLAELPALLARAALFVGNNSGPQHLAAALGIPTIGIHSGVVDAREWAPRGAQAFALRRAMSCSPCFLERPADCQRQLACLTALSVGDVFDACQRFLAAKRCADEIEKL